MEAREGEILTLKDLAAAPLLRAGVVKPYVVTTTDKTDTAEKEADK